MVYVTDTGYVKDEVKQKICDADYYIFESNHDIEMLMQTSRPVYLKQRIIGDSGHLCNEDCANIVCEAMSEKTKEIVLAHISVSYTHLDVYKRQYRSCSRQRSILRT